MAKDKEARVTLKLFNQEFNSAMQETKNETTRLNKEFELQKQQMKLTASEAEQLSAKIEYLKSKQEIANRVTNETATHLENVKAQFGENSREAQQLANKLLEAQIAEQKLANEVSQTTQALERARDAQGKLNSSTISIKDEIKKLENQFELQKQQMQLNATESEKLAAKIDFLNNKQVLMGRATQEVVQDLEKAKASFGENSREAQQLANKLLEAQTAEQKLANEITQTVSALDRARAAENQLESATESTTNSIKSQAQSAEEASKKLNDMGDAAKNAGEKMSGVSAGVAALSAGALVIATDIDSAMVKIQTSIGATEEEAKALGDVAENVWKAGFAGSLDEAAASLIQVKQNMRDLDAGEIETATKSAIALATTFEADVNEVTRAANNLMNNFGIESEKAFDLLAHGAQNGLNFSNELFDNVSEYAGLWANMGFSTEQYFKIMEAGASQGVYNLDYINDVMKEFQIRIKDGSKSTSEAMGSMSKDSQAVWKSFLDGKATVSDVFSQIMPEISKMDDQVVASQIGVSLFGTKWEDLETKAMYAMGNVSAEMLNLDGTMGKMIETQEESFGQRFQGNLRELAAALEPLGLILMDLVDSVMPTITNAITSASTAFSNLSPTIQTIILVIGAFALAIGPILVIIGTLISSISAIVGAIAPLVAAITSAGGVIAFLSSHLSFLTPLFTALTGPIGLTVAAIALLTAAFVTAYQKVDWFRNGVNEIFSHIKSLTSTVFNAVKDLITNLISSAVDFAKGILEKFKAFWDENGKAIVNIVKLYFGMVKTNIEVVLGVIKGIFEAVWPILSAIVKIAWEAIQLIVENSITVVLGIIQTIMKLIQGDWEGAWETIKGIGEGIMNNIIKFFKDIDLLQIGKDIIQGLINGMTSMVDAVWDAVSSIASSVPNWVKELLGIHSPSRVMAEVGKWIPVGLAQGVDQNASSVQKSMEELGYLIIDTAEHFANEEVKINTQLAKDIASINEKSDEKIQKIKAAAKKKKRDLTVAEKNDIIKIEKEAADKIAKIEATAMKNKVKALETSNKEYLQTVQAFIDDKKSLEQLTTIDEAAIWEKTINLFDEGTVERIKAQQNYKKAVETTNNEILSINETYQSKMATISDNLKQQVDAENQKIATALEEKANSFKSFANTFDEYQINLNRTGEELANNLKSQLEAMKMWREEFAKLSSRNVDADLLAEISNLGVKALPELVALNSMTDEQLSEYSAMYQEKSKEAREKAELELVGMKTDAEIRITELRNAANTELDQVERDWMKAIEKITKNTDTELQTLEQVGRDAGQGLLNGLASMEAAILAKAAAIAEGVKAQITSALDIHSPSRVMEGYGENTGEGFAIGLENLIERVKNAATKLTQATTQAATNSSMDYSRTMNNYITWQTSGESDRDFERTVRRTSYLL